MFSLWMEHTLLKSSHKMADVNIYTHSWLFFKMQCNNPPGLYTENPLTTILKNTRLPLPITSADIRFLHMTNPTITVFTFPKMNDPNRVRTTVPKSLKTATAA